MAMSVIERLEMLRSQKSKNWIFRDEDFSAKDGKAIGEALNSDPHVEELALKSIRALTGAFEELADALKENKTLKTLDCRRCSFTTGGAKALAEAFEVNTTLETLYFHEIDSTKDGFKAIANSFRKNKGIKSIDFRCNFHPVETCLELAEALKENTTLTKVLYFSAGPCYPAPDQIADKGAAAFTELIKVSNSLRCLDFQWNRITFPAAQALLEAAAEKKSLQLLDLSYNAITPNDKDKLLAMNKTKRFVPTFWCCSH